MKNKKEEPRVFMGKNIPKDVKKKDINDYDVVSTPIFKLKDRPERRQIQMIDLRYMFGGLPDLIAVQKVPGQNKLMIKAFVPKKKKKVSKEKIASKASQDHV